MSKSFEQAVFCINQGNLLESLRYFELALQEAPPAQHHVIHCNVGSALMALDDLPSAVAAFDDALVLKPQHLESLVNRGIAMSRLLNFDAALDSYSKACEVSPDFHSALCGKSEALANLGRFKEAVVVAQRACALVPSNSLGFADLGYAYLKSGVFKEAVEALDVAFGLTDSEENREMVAVALTQRAVELEMQGQRVAAWEHLHRANALPPALARNLHNEGILLLALGRHDEALDCFLLAVKRNGRHFEARLALGTLLAKLDYLPDAEFHLLEACELDLTSVESRFNLGVARAKMGNSAAARADWQFILDRIQRDEPHATEALRLLGLALQDAKAKGSDGRKETIEVAIKIAGLGSTPSQSSKTTAQPLPFTHLILDGDSHLMGMTEAESERVLHQLDELTNCSVAATADGGAGKRVLTDLVKQHCKEVQLKAGLAAVNANRACEDGEFDSDALIQHCTKATNLSGIAATMVFACLDTDPELALGLLTQSVSSAQAALDAGKLLALAGTEDNVDEVWVESVGNSVQESQQVCEQACKLLLLAPLTGDELNQVRSLQQAARDGQFRAVELCGTGGNVGVAGEGGAVPLLVTQQDGETLLGEDGPALQQQMRALILDNADAERGASALLELVKVRTATTNSDKGALAMINLANLSGVTAATAHALAESNPRLALEIAQASLECASLALEGGNGGDEQDLASRHAAAVAIMEAAEICSSAMATAGDVCAPLRDDCLACEAMATAVLAKTNSAARTATTTVRLPNRLDPMVVPFGSRIATTPTVLTALEFARPRPLVMLHATTGEVAGVGKLEGQHLFQQVDNLEPRNNASQHGHLHQVERGAEELIAKSSLNKSNKDSHVAGLASLTAGLATHSHYLAETNPGLAMQAATTALRTSLASLGTIDPSELDQLEMGEALCKMAYSSSSICSETCAKVLEFSKPHSDLWNEANESSELAAKTMKLSLDVAQQVSEAKASEGYRQHPKPVAPIVRPFCSTPVSLPTKLQAQQFRAPRPLIMTDPATGNVLGMSKPESDELLHRLGKLDHTSTALDTEHVLATAERGTLETKRATEALVRGDSRTELALSQSTTRSANWSGVAALNAHEMAETNPELAVRLAKVSLCSSLASLDALARQEESASDCDLHLVTAQAVMESAEIVAEVLDRVKLLAEGSSSSSLGGSLLAEVEDCQTTANEAWDKASSLAKKASQVKDSDAYRALGNKPVVPSLAPFPAVAVATPERLEAGKFIARRTPLVLTKANGQVAGTTQADQDLMTNWLESPNLAQSALELKNKAQQHQPAAAVGGSEESACYGINLSNLACFQAAELEQKDAKLAVETATAALRCGLDSLTALQDSQEFGPAAAKMMMEASAVCARLCNKLGQQGECLVLADKLMAKAIDVAIASKSQQLPNRQVAMAVPFPAVRINTPAVLQPRQFLVARPLLIVHPADGSLVDTTQAESDLLCAQMDQITTWSEENQGEAVLEQNTRQLLAMAASCKGDSETKRANVAAVVAAHADALTSFNPELAIDAAEAALQLVVGTSSSNSTSAVAKSALQTCNVCADVCGRVLATAEQPALRKKTRDCAVEANRAAKLAIDLVKLHPASTTNANARGTAAVGHWNQPVTVPLHHAGLRPTDNRQPSRTASIETTKSAKAVLLQALRASEACQEAQDLFAKGQEDHHEGRKSLARSCARTAGNAASQSTAAAAMAHRIAEIDPVLSLQLSAAAMQCANNALNASQDALLGDSLNSDVAYRVSTVTADTARVCLDTSRLVLASRSAKSNYYLSEQASQGIKQASELTRRSIQDQNNFRVVLGSAAYQEAKARLRRAENVKKRQSMAHGLLASAQSSHASSANSYNSRSKPAVFGQGLLKRTGVQLVPGTTSSFENVEAKLLRSVLKERSDFKDKFAVKSSPSPAHQALDISYGDSNKIAYLVPGGIEGTFSFTALKTPNCPKLVDPSKKELYLSDDEFIKVFHGKTKQEFFQFPAWKRTREKQLVGIF
ncbi:hypothetical protein BASA81_011297 [Batrachochytrium salamandrivorans]|nr:hypothetical protein BASA81_011297 [Batrachochytrium salamandrivorans]